MSIDTLVVGCGAVIHQIYRNPLQKLERQGILKVIGLVDSKVENALEVSRFFPEAHVYDNLPDALAKCCPDLTIISTPAAFHAEHAILALRKGSHVLCEKPMACSPEECRLMIREAADSNRKLAVAMTRRFYPSLRRLKIIIDSGSLQFPLSFVYREGSQYNWPVMTGSSFRRSSGGGGVLTDKGSHVFDTMLWLFEPFSIVSYRDDAMTDGVEANCMIRIESEKVKGVIQLSWNEELQNTFQIMAADQALILDPDNFSTMKTRKAGGIHHIDPAVSFPADLLAKPISTGTPKTYDECIYYQLVQMARAIELHEDVPVTGEEGMFTICAISDCYAIAEPLDMPWMAEKHNAAYKRLHWRAGK